MRPQTPLTWDPFKHFYLQAWTMVHVPSNLVSSPPRGIKPPLTFFFWSLVKSLTVSLLSFNLPTLTPFFSPVLFLVTIDSAPFNLTTLNCCAPFLSQAPACLLLGC